jgi:hypothetical protein
VNIKDVFITKTVEIDGLNAPIGLLPAPNIASLIGAIELSIFFFVSIYKVLE